MGFTDFFRREKDPRQKLMRMPLRELREKRIEADMQLKSSFRQIEKLRQEFDGLIQKGRESTNDNEQRLLASEAKRVRQRIELLQRDFDGFKDALENLDALVAIREGLGDNATRVEKELQSLRGLSPHEFSKALQARAKDYETARVRMKEADAAFSNYTESALPSTDEPEELALMRQGREPPAAPPLPAEAPGEKAKEKKAQAMTEE